MVRGLLSVARAVRSAWFVELIGAALIVAGVYLLAGVAWSLIAGGVALVLKAFEIDSAE